jgi:hypothetical protein
MAKRARFSKRQKNMQDVIRDLQIAAGEAITFVERANYRERAQHAQRELDRNFNAFRGGAYDEIRFIEQMEEA